MRSAPPHPTRLAHEQKHGTQRPRLAFGLWPVARAAALALPLRQRRHYISRALMISFVAARRAPILKGIRDHTAILLEIAFLASISGI